MKEIFDAEVKSRAKKTPLTNQKYSNWQKNVKTQRFEECKAYPKQDQRKIDFAIIENNSSSSSTCAIMNAVNIFTHLSLNAAQSLLAEGLARLTVIYDSKDQMSKEFLRSSFPGLITFVEVGLPDSEYSVFEPATKDCHNIIYLQNYFTVNSKKILGIAEKVPEYSLAFTLNAYYKEQKKSLKDLRTVDLQAMTQKQFASYLFIFDASFFKFITPLNFAYYNKYLLEEILIVPILAILQKSEKLGRIHSVIHAFQQPHVQFKEFPLPQRAARTQHLCFVGFPTKPSSTEPEKLKEYLDALKSMKKDPALTSFVIELPYFFLSQETLWEPLKIILENQKDLLNLRLRIWPNKAVSSLSVYESAYTYCPRWATIVASRFNIEFHPDFFQKVSASIEEKFHYYGPSFINEQQQTVEFKNLQLVGYELRDKASYFKSHFQPLQVFKSDLLKQHYMYNLKCDEIDFYETEFSYTTPMIESIALKIKQIPETLFTVKRRNYYQVQLEQIKSIMTYLQWRPMADNVLLPKGFNSLGNIAFRKNAPARIPKKIHQIWISQQEISPIRMRLHQTFKEVNPDYEVNIWTHENITEEKFPLTHALVYTALEHEKYDRISYKSAIADFARVQLLYNEGGFYFDFKYEALKPLDPFRKYEILFAECDYTNFYRAIQYFGNPTGVEPMNYYLGFVLNRIFSPDTFDLADHKFHKLTGSWNYVHAFTDEEILTVPGFGFQLLMPGPQTKRLHFSECETQKQFTPDQEVLIVRDRQKREFKIGIPCRQYKQAYAVIYWSLSKTWIGTKRPVN